MAREKRLSLLITGDAKQAQKALADLERTAGKSGKGTEKALDGIKGKLLAIGAGAAVKSVVGAASDLAEAQGKVGQVFKGSQKEMEDWADSAAKSMGQSKRAALDAAGTYGNLFQSFGIGADKAKGMSKTLVQLASDLASFNNTSVEDAIDALRSGLSGETEPLKRYGIAINDARLRQEAMALGIEVGTGALDQQTKTLAAYQAIMEDSTIAQGDFGRTSDGLANSQRIAAAEFENAKAKLGEDLLPVMTDATKLASGLMGAFSDLDPATRNAALATTALVTAYVKWGDSLKETASGLRGVRGGLSSTVGSLSKMDTAMAGIAAGTASFGITLEILKAMSDPGVNVSGLAEDLDQLAKGQAKVSDLSGSLGTDIRGLAADFSWAEQAPRDYGDALGYVATHIQSDFGSTKMREAQNRIRSLDQTFADMIASGNIEQARVAYGELANELRKQGIEAETVASLMPGYWDALDRARRGNEEGASGAVEMTDSMADQQDQAEKTGDALDSMAGYLKDVADKADRADQRIRDFYDTLSGNVSTQSDAEAALDDLASRLDENGVALSISADKGRENRAAMRDARDAFVDYALSLKQTDGPQAAVNAMEEYRLKLIETLTQGGYTEEQVKSLIEELGLTPTDIHTTFGSNAGDEQVVVQGYKDEVKNVPTFWETYFSANIEQAMNQLAVLGAALTPFGNSALSGTAGRAAQEYLDRQRRGVRQGPPRAGGGSVFPGVLYPINEKGVEGFVPSVPGRVIPNDQIGSVLGGSSTLTLAPSITIVESSNPRETARQVVAEIRRMTRADGGRSPIQGDVLLSDLR